MRPDDAIQQIRSDLEYVWKRRGLALAAYVALLMALFLLLALAPRRPAALERDTLWAVALAAFFVAALLGGAAAMGRPLVSHRAALAITTISIALNVSALSLVMDFGPPVEPLWQHGLPCLAFGSVVAAGAMIVLGALGGALWRRFPDPALLVAAGTTAVGLAALHYSCGVVDAVHLLGFHLTPLVVSYGLARVAVGTKDRLAYEESTLPK